MSNLCDCGRQTEQRCEVWKCVRDTPPVLEPGWLIEGAKATPIRAHGPMLSEMSARDYSESHCCGRAPGSCPECPLIVESATLHERFSDCEHASGLVSQCRCVNACRHSVVKPSVAPLIVKPVLHERQSNAVYRSPRLTTDSAERKATPIATGVLDYFPLAMAAVARLSKRGNDKHNPGEPLHWAREKSTDHADCCARHLIERGTVEPESGELHEACLAWRALALLELAEEKRLGITPASV